MPLKSAKGAVSRHHAMKELSVEAARTRPVLRVFLKGAPSYNALLDWERVADPPGSIFEYGHIEPTGVDHP